MLYVYERNRTEPFQQNPLQAARQGNYYSFQNTNGTPDDSVESLLGLVETDAVPIIREMASQDAQLTWEQRARVALFIALQELRVPWARQNVQNLSGDLIQRLAEFRATVPNLLEADLHVLEDQGQAVRGITADSLREFIQRREYTVEVNPIISLITMLRLAALLQGHYVEMKWTVIRGPGAVLFRTSDNPVVKFDTDFGQGFYGGGLYSPSIEVRFPLSKTACLIITHDRERENTWYGLVDRGQESEADELRRAVPHISLLQILDAGVDEINALTARYATRFVYSPVRDARIGELIQGNPQSPTVVTSTTALSTVVM
jgi:hypothetical protein